MFSTRSETPRVAEGRLLKKYLLWVWEQRDSSVAGNHAMHARHLVSALNLQFLIRNPKSCDRHARNLVSTLRMAMKRLRKNGKLMGEEQLALRSASRIQSIIQLSDETSSQAGARAAEKEKEKPITAYVSWVSAFILSP